MKETPRILENDLEREAQVDATAKHWAFAASLVRVLCKLLANNQGAFHLVSKPLCFAVCYVTCYMVFASIGVYRSGLMGILGHR